MGSLFDWLIDWLINILNVGEVKVNPTLLEMERSSLDLIYAGTDGRTLM